VIGTHTIGNGQPKAAFCTLDRAEPEQTWNCLRKLRGYEREASRDVKSVAKTLDILLSILMAVVVKSFIQYSAYPRGFNLYQILFKVCNAVRKIKVRNW
jgi:hypothetical protein